MEIIQEDENVEHQIDKLNTIVANLMKDFDDSRSEIDKFSMISPIESFSDSFVNYHESTSEYSLESFNIPQEIIEKFQENLIEIDRLNMKMEDILGNWSRYDNSLFEISLSKNQIQNLHRDTEKLIKENANSALIKVGKNLFILESTERSDKIIYYSGNIQPFNNFNGNNSTKSQSEISEAQDISMSFENKNKDIEDHPQDLNNYAGQLHTESNLLKLHAELELRQINLLKKEEKARNIEEELGYKLQKLESLKSEYTEKISELNKQSILQNSFSNGSQKALKEFNNSNEKSMNYFSGLDCKNIELNNHAALSNKKYSSENLININPEKNQSISDFNEPFITNRKQFAENLCFLGNFSNKEAYIMNYLKEQRNYQDLKLQEIQKYENYLYEI